MPEHNESRDSIPYRPVPLAELENAARMSPTVLPYLLASQNSITMSTRLLAAPLQHAGRLPG